MNKWMRVWVSFTVAWLVFSVAACFSGNDMTQLYTNPVFIGVPAFLFVTGHAVAWIRRG